MAERLGHPRQQLVLRVSVRGVAHHALLFGELLVEQQRVVPVEAGLGGVDRLFGSIHGGLRGMAPAAAQSAHATNRVGDYGAASGGVPAAATRVDTLLDLNQLSPDSAAGITAVASISSRAPSSTSPATATALIAG